MSQFPTVSDPRSDMFPKAIVEQNYTPENEDDSSAVSLSNGTAFGRRQDQLRFARMVRFVPPVEGHFEEILIPYPDGSESPIHQWTNLSPEEQRQSAKQKSCHRVLSEREGEAFVIRERRRRHLWAKLSDHLLDIEQHDLQEIRSQLSLSDDEFNTATTVAAKVTELRGAVSDEDLMKAQKELRVFKESYSSDEIDDSRRLSNRVTELQEAVSMITKNRKKLQKIQDGHPLMFQSPEERERMNPTAKTPKKAENHDNSGTPSTQSQQAAPAADRARQCAAG